METVTLFEWTVGGIFVGINAYRRYNTPTTNRASTTFQNFITFFLFYLASILVVYVFIGALLDSSPKTLGTIFSLAGLNLPEELNGLSPPMMSALLLTTLLPSLPFLSGYDKALLNHFWERGHIPNHVNKMAAEMRRAPFSFSPGQIKYLRKNCEYLNINYDSLDIDSGLNLDFRWARINVLLSSMLEWKQDDSSKCRHFLNENKDEINELIKLRDEINQEFIELKAENLEEHILHKLENYLDKTIATLFRRSTLIIAKGACVTELYESGRNLRISQLGFEIGSQGGSLTSRQISLAIISIFVTFFSVSLIQELSSDADTHKFSKVIFMTFLMFFTYGSALIIALDLKTRVGMGYNELTRQRPWIAYLFVGLLTTLSWIIVTFSYRYILNMLSGMDSGLNLTKVVEAIGWSYPYAVQSLALAVTISWILDHHQSRGMSGKPTSYQRYFDVGISIFALSLASVIAFSWMEGIGIFEEFMTRDPKYAGRTSFVWFMAKGIAVASIVSWLIPMWFYLNRRKSPDQIASRLILMNKKEISNEIRNLQPDELINIVASVSASVAAIDNDVSRYEKEVFQIIASHLAGLQNSDVDLDTAESEFEECLTLIENGELNLEEKLVKLNKLPYLSALMPFIASSIAFADGVYLEEENKVVEEIKGHLQLQEIS